MEMTDYTININGILSMSDNVIALLVLLKIGIAISIMVCLSAWLASIYIAHGKRMAAIREAQEVADVRDKLRLLEIKIKAAQEALPVLLAARVVDLMPIIARKQESRELLTKGAYGFRTY